MRILYISILLLVMVCTGMFASTSALALQFSELLPTGSNVEVESRVRLYFADVPAMIDIAKCETGFRQFGVDGQVLKDATGSYIGLFQIDEQTHAHTALAAGFNIFTLEGNMGYARYLHAKSGTQPWKGCVSSSAQAELLVLAPASAKESVLPTARVTKNLRMGMTNPEVRILQQILNGTGFIVAASGPGSPGNETSSFGLLTREAVKKFQCAQGIACSDSEATTGYGRIGPLTRAALNK